MPYGTGTSRLRHDYARRQSSNTAIASFDRGVEPGAWDQPEDGSEVAEATVGRRQEDWTEGASLNCLSEEEEAVVVAFRQHTLLPLDDCLYALQPTIPHLTRSSLHRCLQRHGISRLPDMDGDKPKKQRFKRYPIGFFHIDIAELRTTEGKLYLFVVIDRTSKFAVAQLVEKADRKTAWEFLELLLDTVPYRIHTILTDNVLAREGNAVLGVRSWGIRATGYLSIVAQAGSAVKKWSLP